MGTFKVVLKAVLICEMEEVYGGQGVECGGLDWNKPHLLMCAKA